MCFDSFWDVYNRLRDAVDSEFLFQSNNGLFNEESASGDNVDRLPLHHLRPCEFGKDGIPDQQSVCEGEPVVCQSHFSGFSLMSPEVPESENLAGLGEEELGKVFRKLLIHTCSHSPR